METVSNFGAQHPPSKSNILQLTGNSTTMNLNNMIYSNIVQSPYFKTELAEVKTYHEVIDKIYFKVEHLEPWEKGSRKTGSLTGMCGGVRGVGAGGIVSTPFCLLYKLFTLKLTRKQLCSMLDHPDSPYIRALGFMYIRYCLQPKDIWTWYEPYMDDPEEIDVKAGGGAAMTIGSMLHQFLTKLDWYGTLFPRIPVPVQKDIDVKLRERAANASRFVNKIEPAETPIADDVEERMNRGGSRLSRSPHHEAQKRSYREDEDRHKSSRSPKDDASDRHKHHKRPRSRERHHKHGHRSRSSPRHNKDHKEGKDRHRSKHKHKHHSSSHDRKD